MRKLSYKAIMLTSVLSLTGCMGIYEGGFECPPGEGVGCKSISEVNDMVNHKEIPKTAPSAPSPSNYEKCSVQEPSIGNKEETKIWVAPWAMVEA